MAQQIKLMADYDCWPLWWEGDHGPGNINPATLPLSAETVARLEAWAATFDATLNRTDPAASGFPSDAAFQAFEAEGRALWRQLRAELAPEYEVLYHGFTGEGLLDDLSAS
jgi:hypothetical protein